MPPKEVIDAIMKRYPDKCDEILKELKFDSIMGCFYFIRDGVFFGVEKDGYIHT